jgi:hypothetical protein
MTERVGKSGTSCIFSDRLQGPDLVTVRPEPELPLLSPPLPSLLLLCLLFSSRGLLAQAKIAYANLPRVWRLMFFAGAQRLQGA